jgi:hypothetical protein
VGRSARSGHCFLTSAAPARTPLPPPAPSCPPPAVHHTPEDWLAGARGGRVTTDDGLKAARAIAAPFPQCPLSSPSSHPDQFTAQPFIFCLPFVDRALGCLRRIVIPLAAVAAANKRSRGRYRSRGEGEARVGGSVGSRGEIGITRKDGQTKSREVGSVGRGLEDWERESRGDQGKGGG